MGVMACTLEGAGETLLTLMAKGDPIAVPHIPALHGERRRVPGEWYNRDGGTMLTHTRPVPKRIRHGDYAKWYR